MSMVKSTSALKNLNELAFSAIASPWFSILCTTMLNLSPTLLKHWDMLSSNPAHRSAVLRLLVVNVDESGEQRDLLFDHIAILEETTPRCPPERCGVGVYDSKMTKEEKTPGALPEEVAEGKSSTEVVPAEQKETKEPVAAKVEATPDPPAEPDKDSVISELKERLAKREEQLTELRKPLVDVLTQRGYQAQELNPLSISTLQKMVSQSVSSTTEGLPGTVPAPAPEPVLTLAEAREKEQKRHTEALEKRQKERWKDM
jgi:hypothetical protein